LDLEKLKPALGKHIEEVLAEIRMKRVSGQ
jgi:hypothetical protein